MFLQCFKTVCVPTDLEPVISMYYMLLWFFFKAILLSYCLTNHEVKSKAVAVLASPGDAS